MIILLGQNSILLALIERLTGEGVVCRMYGKDTSINTPGYTAVQTVNELFVELENFKGKALFISGGAPWLFKSDFLKAFEPDGIFNLHGTPLPQDRGGTIVSWLILNKKRLGIAAIHKMTASPDEGPILDFKEFIYPSNCVLPQDYLLEYNCQIEDLAWEICLKYEQGILDLNQTNQQPSYLSTYWPRLSSKINGAIDWSLEGDEIDRFIKAFDDPYPGAFTYWRDKKIILKKSFFQYDSNYHPSQWGMVYRKRITSEFRYLAVAVKSGSLIIREVQDEEGNDLFNSILEGDRLYTSSHELDLAKRRLFKTGDKMRIQNNLQ